MDEIDIDIVEMKARIGVMEIAVAVMIATLPEGDRTGILSLLEQARNSVEDFAGDGPNMSANHTAVAWDRLIDHIHGLRPQGG